MPSGGKRDNVRHSGGLPKPSVPVSTKESRTKEVDDWKFKMWDRHGRDHWERKLGKGDPKAHLELFKRIHPDLAKLSVGGDREADPIKIILESPLKDKKEVNKED